MEAEYVPFSIDPNKLRNILNNMTDDDKRLGTFLLAFTRLVEIDPTFVIGKRSLAARIKITSADAREILSVTNGMIRSMAIVTEDKNVKKGHILMHFAIIIDNEEAIEFKMLKLAYKKCEFCDKKARDTCQRCFSYSVCKTHAAKDHNCMKLWLCESKDCYNPAEVKCNHCKEVGFCKKHYLRDDAHFDHLSKSTECVYNCTQKARQWCKICLNAAYCSDEHELGDWESHKHICEQASCEVCEKTDSLLYCICRMAKYCSKEHQRLDFEKHKKICTKEAPKCKVCKRQGLNPCPCGKVFYCSEAHRSEDWDSEHRYVCTMKRLCYVCGKATKYKCTCKKIYYCSEDHRYEDWNRHQEFHKK